MGIENPQSPVFTWCVCECEREIEGYLDTDMCDGRYITDDSPPP